MAHHEPEPDGGGWTGYALVKYGIILVIVIVVLFFIVRFLFPALTGGDDTEPPEGPDVEVTEAFGRSLW